MLLVVHVNGSQDNIHENIEIYDKERNEEHSVQAFDIINGHHDIGKVSCGHQDVEVRKRVLEVGEIRHVI